MANCPDCNSSSVQSKGLRTKGVHRYLCNDCGRNFTVRTEGNKTPSVKVPSETVSNKTTIQIDTQVKDFLEKNKLISQEPLNSVMRRLLNIQ